MAQKVQRDGRGTYRREVAQREDAEQTRLTTGSVAYDHQLSGVAGSSQPPELLFAAHGEP